MDHGAIGYTQQCLLPRAKSLFQPVNPLVDSLQSVVCRCDATVNNNIYKCSLSSTTDEASHVAAGEHMVLARPFHF
jgi:hypothetical protein